VLLAAMLASTVAAAPACASYAVPDQGKRFQTKAFKGAELFSWMDHAGHYRFSLHWGTNRTKSEREIKSPSCVLPDVPAVKRAVSRLAEGEWVSWNPEAGAHLTLPTPMVVDDIVATCRTLGIHVSVSATRP
jgi:hypothetical protein